MTPIDIPLVEYVAGHAMVRLEGPMRETLTANAISGGGTALLVAVMVGIPAWSLWESHVRRTMAGAPPQTGPAVHLVLPLAAAALVFALDAILFTPFLRAALGTPEPLLMVQQVFVLAGEDIPPPVSAADFDDLAPYMDTLRDALTVRARASLFAGAAAVAAAAVLVRIVRHHARTPEAARAQMGYVLAIGVLAWLGMTTLSYLPYWPAAVGDVEAYLAMQLGLGGPAQAAQ